MSSWFCSYSVEFSSLWWYTMTWFVPLWKSQLKHELIISILGDKDYRGSIVMLSGIHYQISPLLPRVARLFFKLWDGAHHVQTATPCDIQPDYNLKSLKESYMNFCASWRTIFSVWPTALPWGPKQSSMLLHGVVFSAGILKFSSNQKTTGDQSMGIFK